MMNVSQLHFYSIGVVATNKKLTSHFVEVTPIEDNAFMDGEITDHNEEYKAKSASLDGQKWETKIDTTASVRAKWLPMCNSNRITSPDVRRGETVALYRFGDVDEYYWTTLLQDKHIRRLETVIYSFSNNKEENKEDTSESTYYMEVSTHKKLIHLHTSKNDKEPFSYDIQINTKDGIIIITDDVDNYFYIDSKNTRIKLENKDKSCIDMDKKKITITAPDKIEMVTKDFILKASNSATVETNTYTRKTTNDFLQANHYKVNMITAEYKGDITAIGKYDHTGPITNEGDITNEGGITNAGPISNTGSITNNGNIANIGEINQEGSIRQVGTFYNERIETKRIRVERLTGYEVP